MLTFKDADGSGVVLRDSGEAHAVGEDANMPPEKGVKPKPGEIYLHFTNVESAKALRLTLYEAIAEMSNAEAETSARSDDSCPAPCSAGLWDCPCGYSYHNGVKRCVKCGAYKPNSIV